MFIQTLLCWCSDNMIVLNPTFRGNYDSMICVVVMFHVFFPIIADRITGKKSPCSCCVVFQVGFIWFAFHNSFPSEQFRNCDFLDGITDDISTKQPFFYYNAGNKILFIKKYIHPLYFELYFFNKFYCVIQSSTNGYVILEIIAWN